MRKIVIEKLVRISGWESFWGQKIMKLKELEGFARLATEWNRWRKEKIYTNFCRVNKKEFRIWWTKLAIYNISFSFFVIFCLPRRKVWVVGLRTLKLSTHRKAIAKKRPQQTRHSHCTRHNRSSRFYNINSKQLSSILIVSILPKRVPQAWIRVQRKISVIYYVKRNYFTVI